MRRGFHHWTVLIAALPLWGAVSLPAADLLPGEFDDIDLGRTLVYPERFPTVRQCREIVRKPEICTVMVIRMFGSRDNHYLPIFSGDGRRLAFQRSDVQAKSSKLLLYKSLRDPEPALLSRESTAYDYMFRWGINSPSSFTLVRIDPGKTSTQIYFSADGENTEQKTLDTGRRLFPALYRRTDGIWRLVYEQDGRVMHQAWNAKGPIDSPLALTRGSAPRWSDDGYRLLLIQERERRGKADFYDVVVRNLRSEKEQLLFSGENETVRSPSWSHDERSAAFYVRNTGDRPWRIHVCPVQEHSPGKTLGNDVVVNPNFESEGPAWEPSSRRVWFFSHERRRQAYYPLLAADVESGALTVVDYPRKITTPMDLAVNPTSAVPEMAFVAHVGLPQDLFLVFLNHY
ncbi:MAG: hypothetical protein JXB10_04135 [Pirellulales bacterium]|nr:hypothetical protein [Pirellulales bacterium]